jgi:hypothetical protein
VVLDDAEMSDDPPPSVPPRPVPDGGDVATKGERPDVETKTRR